MLRSSLTRRAILKTAALTPPALAASSLAAPFVHGAYAAGTLSMGAWDHWVPGASQVLQKMCTEWAEKEKVELKVDLITSSGDKDLLTLMAEGQARAGHDIMGLRLWYVSAQAGNFVPLDDLVDPLIQKYGKISQGCEYTGKVDGHWMAMPSSYGSASLPPCARIDMLKEYAGLDVQKMYPGPGTPPDMELQDQWTWDTMLVAAEKCFKAGHPCGPGLSVCTDALNMIGAMFASYGVQLVDKDGNITVKNDKTKVALEWFQKLAKVLPGEVFAYHNAPNNKALVSGQSALIFNPPSADALAVRDNRKLAEQLWTFPSPKGPMGRYDPANYYYWGIWNFSKNIPAAKGLLAYITTRENQEKLVAASSGFDTPPFSSFMDFKVWEEVEPPKYTVYNYPPRGDDIPSTAGRPAPFKIRIQIFDQAPMSKMIAQCTQQGKSIEQALTFAESELEGFMRS